MMKHRMSKTEDGRKALRAIEECKGQGIQVLDLNGEFCVDTYDKRGKHKLNDEQTQSLAISNK